MYYPIDEAAAKQANTMNSFSDYKAGSATADYKEMVDSAAALAEAKKRQTSPFYHSKIDSLLDSYSRRLANWINATNRNRASCPSILISGGSNFPTAKKKKQNAREEALMHEYDDIKGILGRIKAVGTGPVDLADPHAREILEGQLKDLEKQSADGKAINAYYRKHKTIIGCPVLSEKVAKKMQDAFEEIRQACPIHDAPYPAYELTSIRGKIKRVQERLQQLEKLESIPQEESTIDFDGGQIVKNTEQNRLQILFDEKPDEDTRQALKSNGFRWSPRNGAWQRQLTDNAMRAAKAALGI